MNLRRIGTLLLLAVPTAASAQLTRSAADSAWVRGDRAAARGLYLVAVAEDRTDAVALFRLGLIESWSGRPRQGLEWFDRLLSLHPDDRDARTARARAMAAAGDLDGAIQAVDSILTSHPREAGALAARARFATWQRDDALAGLLWRKALEADPDHVEARAGLAGTLRRQGRLSEAEIEIERALAAAPEDADVRTESDYIDRQTGPRVRSAITVEDDSDGNTIRTLSAGSALRSLANRLDIRLDGWRRHAGLDAGSQDMTATGFRVGLALDANSGWSFSAAAGASAAGSPDGATRAALSTSLTSPRSRTIVVTFNASRTPLDYTLPLIRNRVDVSEAAASLALRHGRDWDLTATVAAGVFDVGRTGDDSRRLAFQTYARRRITDHVALGAGIRGFGFDRDIDGGFFDPDLYVLADAALELRFESRRWLLGGEVAPGLQHVDGGAVGGAIRAEAGVTWRLRPGREITVRGTFANTGFEALSAGADTTGSYRYASLGAALAWWF